MKQIDISTKKYPNIYTLVDDKDFKFLNQWKWGISTKGYVVRKDKMKNISMHRVVNNTLKGLQTDHINRNKLDNRRSNLRNVTNRQNHLNMPIQKNNKSGYPGICFDKYNNKWRVQITIMRKTIQIGRFINLESAIFSRKEAEKVYYAHA